MRRYGFFEIANPFTLSHWQNLFGDPVFFSSVRNSLIIAAAWPSSVIALYSLVAYSIVRNPSRATRATDLLVWVPWAVPGILMSLGLLWLFLGTPLRTCSTGHRGDHPGDGHQGQPAEHAVLQGSVPCRSAPSWRRARA